MPSAPRRFGLTLSLALSVLAFLNAAKPVVLSALLSVITILLVSSLFVPAKLTRFEQLAAKLLVILAASITKIALVVIYLLVVTPLGLLRRIFGADPLTLKPDYNADSYWTELNATADHVRLRKPY